MVFDKKRERGGGSSRGTLDPSPAGFSPARSTLTSPGTVRVAGYLFAYWLSLLSLPLAAFDFQKFQSLEKGTRQTQFRRLLTKPLAHLGKGGCSALFGKHRTPWVAKHHPASCAYRQVFYWKANLPGKGRPLYNLTCAGAVWKVRLDPLLFIQDHKYAQCFTAEQHKLSLNWRRSRSIHGLKRRAGHGWQVIAFAALLPARDRLNQSRSDAARRLWSQMAKEFRLPQHPWRSRLEAMGRICLLRAKNTSNWIGKRPIYDYESNQGHLKKAELYFHYKKNVGFSNSWG